MVTRDLILSTFTLSPTIVKLLQQVIGGRISVNSLHICLRISGSLITGISISIVLLGVRSKTGAAVSILCNVSTSQGGRLHNVVELSSTRIFFKLSDITVKLITNISQHKKN